MMSAKKKSILSAKKQKRCYSKANDCTTLYILQATWSSDPTSFL